MRTRLSRSTFLLTISIILCVAGRRNVVSFIGEVVNRSATQAFSVTVRAVIYDPCQETTNTLTLPTLLPATLPQQSAPIDLGSFCATISEDMVRSLTFDHVIPISASTIRPLTVLPQAIGCSCYGASYGCIAGSVRNDNTVAVAGIRVVAWSLRNDHSLGLGSEDIAGPLAPGAEAGFLTGYFPWMCVDGKPHPDVRINSFQYAAQGIVTR
jgi:hypothetical protein